MYDEEAHDSYSFLPVLNSQDYQKPIREATIHHSLNGDFSIRQGDWKYIDASGHGGFAQIKESVTSDSIQLYNLAVDPIETTNVYVRNPEKATQLKLLLEKYKEQGYSRFK
jgi:arylsulfatase A-like enzyme